MEEVKKTIGEWSNKHEVTILDPDGFDRKNPNLHNELFTEGEFLEGLSYCTIMYHKIKTKEENEK